MSTERREVEKRLQGIVPDGVEVVALGENATGLRPNGAGVCDFCCERLVGEVHTLPAHTAKVDDTPMGDFVSVGDWGACDACKTLIDANDRKALLQRYVDWAVKRYGRLERARFVRNGRRAHDTYFASRITEN